MTEMKKFVGYLYVDKAGASGSCEIRRGISGVCRWRTTPGRNANRSLQARRRSWSRSPATTNPCSACRFNRKQTQMTAEHVRLDDARAKNIPWKKWGPYLSERQWGTVREDYSEGGDAWNYFTHDQARSAPTAGAKTAWLASPTTSNGSASPSPCGTARTRSSRSACSA